MVSLVLAAKSAYNSVSDVVSAGTRQFRYLSDRILSDSIKAAPDAVRSAANGLKQFAGYSALTAVVSMVAASFFKTEECYTPSPECITIPASWFRAAEHICTQPDAICTDIEPSLTVVMPVVALALGTAYVAGKMFSSCIRCMFAPSAPILPIETVIKKTENLIKEISDEETRRKIRELEISLLEDEVVDSCLDLVTLNHQLSVIARKESADRASDAALGRLDKLGDELMNLASAIPDSEDSDEEDNYGAGLANGHIQYLNKSNFGIISPVGGPYTAAWSGNSFIDADDEALGDNQDIVENSPDHEGRCGCLSRLWTKLTGKESAQVAPVGLSIVDPKGEAIKSE